MSHPTEDKLFPTVSWWQGEGDMAGLVAPHHRAAVPGVRGQFVPKLAGVPAAGHCVLA